MALLSALAMYLNLPSGTSLRLSQDGRKEGAMPPRIFQTIPYRRQTRAAYLWNGLYASISGRGTRRHLFPIPAGWARSHKNVRSIVIQIRQATIEYVPPLPPYPKGPMANSHTTKAIPSVRATTYPRSSVSPTRSMYFSAMITRGLSPLASKACTIRST